MMRWRRQSARGAAGFTIAELLLGLTLSTAVGLVVATMLAALESTTRAERDTRRANVQKQIANVRLSALMRGAARALAVDDENVVLWTGDMTNDGAVNISELRVIRLQTASAEIWTYEVPHGVVPVIDTAYALDADFLTVADNLIGAGELPGEIIVVHVTAWTIELNQPDPLDATLMSCAATVETENGSIPVTCVAAFRATPSGSAF